MAACAYCYFEASALWWQPAFCSMLMKTSWFVYLARRCKHREQYMCCLLYSGKKTRGCLRAVCSSQEISSPDAVVLQSGVHRHPEQQAICFHLSIIIRMTEYAYIGHETHTLNAKSAKSDGIHKNKLFKRQHKILSKHLLNNSPCVHHVSLVSGASEK